MATSASPAGERAGERAQIGAEAVRKAQDRAAAPPVEVRDRGEEGLGRTGAANSAAAVGVGARTSAAWSIRVQSVSWPTAAMERDHAAGGRAHHRFIVEAHEVLERAAAARDDQHVGTRHGPPIDGERVEAVDRGGDLGGGGLALNADRPDDHPNREAVGEAMQDVADDGAGRRRHHADNSGQERRPGRLRAASNSPSSASFLRRASSSAISAPIPASSSVSITEIW